MDLGIATFDSWVDYVLHVKWDATGKTGVLQVWQNGVLVLNQKGISLGYSDVQNPYFKVGMYCWTGQSKYAKKNIYLDEVRIGNATADYNAVAPGRSDNSGKVAY